MNVMALSWPWITLDEDNVQHIFKFEAPDGNVSLCQRFTIVDIKGKPLRVGLLPHEEGRDFSGACKECVAEWNRVLI